MVGNQWNYAAWKPYWQCAGPRYFAYVPHSSMDFRVTLRTMAIEEHCMAENDEKHAISNAVKRRVAKAYARGYEQGRWLSKLEKRGLSFVRVGAL